MPTQPYLIDGERVPGTTTILSRFKESGALMWWAWDQGRQGKDFRETKQAAADAGTIAHLMVECDIYGAPFDASPYAPELLDKAHGAFKGYLEWKQQTQLQVVESEVALVSRAYRYGGTLDAVAVRGSLALLDWKTSNGVYADYLLQLAAYGQLWNEHHPDQPLTGGFHLLRFGKPDHPDDPVSFEHRYWSDLNVAWEQFKLFRAAYDLDKRIKKLV